MSKDDRGEGRKVKVEDALAGMAMATVLMAGGVNGTKNDACVGYDYNEGHPLVHGVVGVLGFECDGGNDMDIRWRRAGGDGALASIFDCHGDEAVSI